MKISAGEYMPQINTLQLVNVGKLLRYKYAYELNVQRLKKACFTVIHCDWFVSRNTDMS